MHYKQVETICSWIAFITSASLYFITIEPSVSFWDSGEFIAGSYKLQITHPPGAPFYTMLGRIFTLFAGDPSQVAISVNIMSLLASSFTIMILFLTITHLAKKILTKTSKSNTLIIMGAGFTGAFSFAFSDTFWHIATEAEVYALSSLLSAAILWAVLKWEEQSGESFSNRWILLAAYLTGISTGVHPLSLLVIPAAVFVVYFRYCKTPGLKEFFTASAIAIFLPLAIKYLIVERFLLPATLTELLFVNFAGLPFNSGTLFYITVIVILLIYGIAFTRKREKPALHTLLLFTALLLTGYSSYSLTVIRSAANPPINQGSPDNVFSLLSYLGREQYGKRPLLYGPLYNTPVTGEKSQFTSRIKKDGRYAPSHSSGKPEYCKNQKTFFPRMHSSHPDHVEAYREWGKIEGIKPTFGDNIRFFITYQLGHMYGRYLMWNFAGRQNDIQGHGRILDGNWLSGLHFIDQERLGPLYGMPDHMQKNRGRKKYYMLPLILGIVGLLFQIQHNKRYASVIFLLFFFTGAAVVIYLNQTPYESRERDYIHAGSFYAFSIWIGIGVLALYENLKKYAGTGKGALFSSALSIIFIPGVMAVQNIEHHNRSDRYIARDMAWNYLQTCAPDAILFTWGDNDTFPLWYLQEVEGVRTDVRVVNINYLNTDWYITQMKRSVHQSAPLTIAHHNSNKSPLLPKITGMFPKMDIDKYNIYRSTLLIFDIIANNYPDRPVYFTTAIPPGKYAGFDNYLEKEGVAYRLVSTPKPKVDNYSEAINTGLMFHNITEKYRWGNINDPRVYLDQTARYMASDLRCSLGRLAIQLIDEDRSDSALIILNKTMNLLPNQVLPLDRSTLPVIKGYYLAGEVVRASEMAKKHSEILKTELNYYLLFDRSLSEFIEDEQYTAISIYRELLGIVSEFDHYQAKEMEEYLGSYLQFLLGT